MAYNSGFPATYPQYYPQYNPQQYQQNSSVIWVQGENAAKSYPCAPNSTVVLWDSESQCIFWKTCDASGMPSMRIIDYTIRSEPVRKAQNALSGTNSTTVTVDDLNGLQSQIDALKQQIESMRTNDEPALQRNAKRTAKQPVTEVSAVQTGISG